MKIELGLEGDCVVFADLEIGRACLMRGKRDAIFVKVDFATAMVFEETDYGGVPVVVVHPEDETVKPMDLVGIQARPRGT